MKRTVLFILCAVLSAGFGFAQSDLQPAAIVNLIKSEPITVKQLRTQVELFEKSRGRNLTHAERLEVLNNLINERLIAQAAERDKLVVTESEVNQQIQQFRAQMSQAIGHQPTDAEFAQAVRGQTGLEIPAFREQARMQLIMQKYLMAKRPNIGQEVTEPTEEEITNTYNLLRAQFVRPETVRFSMIQVAYGNDKVKAKELADRLYREVGSNAAKFDEVALRGTSASAGYQGGDGGFLPRNMEAEQLVGRDFMNTAFSLKIGEVSKLMEGARGFQFIKVTEAYTMKNLELGDTFYFGRTETVRDIIRAQLGQQSGEVVLARTMEELVTELRSSKSFQILEKNISW